mgnify:CR=1 FL=1
MRLYTVRNFPGFNPVGFAAVILAHNKQQAKILFEEEVVKTGLELNDRNGVPKKYEINATTLSKEFCSILVNGDY